MKVLQVVHGFPPKQRAGTEIYTYYLSKELAKNHDVHVIYPEWEDVKEPTLVSFNQEDLILHELKLPANSKLQRFWSMLFFENTYINKEIESLFESLVIDINPDIIHFEHLINLSTTFIEIAKKLSIPTVLTLHDYWFMCPNIQLLRHDYTICEGPEPTKCRDCWIKKQSENLSEALAQYHIPKTLAKLPSELFLRTLNKPEDFARREEYLRNLLAKVDKIIAPSRFLREIFVKYGVPKNKIIYSENGYSLNVFKGFKKKKRSNKIIFGFAGGIARHKGVHILVDAFLNVPDDRAELRIYGSYSQKSKYVKELLEKTRNRKNIKFMGRYEDVKDPFSEIDVLIVPSICYETGGPLVVREALATKTPIIASRIGSIPELIIDGINGILFEPKNPRDLYGKIMKIIKNPELIEKFKANIEPPKSIDEQAKEIERIYIEVMERDQKVS